MLDPDVVDGLLFSSSSEVYGKLNRRGLREADDRLIGSPAKSRWSYAIAKEFGEALARPTCRNTEPR